MAIETAIDKTTKKNSKSSAQTSGKVSALKIEVAKPSANIEDTKADLLVVFTAKVADTDKATKGKASKKAGTSFKGFGEECLAKLHAGFEEGTLTGAASEAVLYRNAELGGARHFVAVGVGDAKEFTAESVRQAAAAIVSNAKTVKAKSIAIAFDSLPESSEKEAVTLQALAEGLLLSCYSFAEFKGGKKEEGIEKAIVLTSSKSKTLDQAIATGQTLAECVNFSRWLGDRPGNLMTPTLLGEETVKAAKGTKLKVTVWDRKKIQAEKMNSFLSVSLGSSQEPKFIVMEYKGAAASKKPVCFVGKGLTFDSGGISIKPSAGMEEMKYDMCGGANVIGAMLAIAKLGLKINAIGLVPTTENMPGPSANKPGDIVIARNGKSIEVNNTDAEGRLILNDALVYACEQKPAAIFDAATLTGAMVVALGNLHTGFFTRNDKLAAAIDEAAKTTGEWVWRMPLTDFHVRDMKGTYADLSNISSSKGAGSATAAAFLEQFVDKDIPWAHFDIAGTGWHTGDRVPYNPRKGASGAMIRTFVELAGLV